MLDRNGDGSLSWDELTGTSFASVWRGDGRVPYYERPDASCLGPLFGKVNKDVRLLLVSWMCVTASPRTVALLCKQLSSDVHALQAQGTVPSSASRRREFVPTDALEGTISCPLPLVTVAALKERYADLPWLKSMEDYHNEMGHRRLQSVKWQECFLITDGPAEDVDLVIEVAGVHVKHRMRTAGDSFFFLTEDSDMFKEATGEKPILPPKLHSDVEDLFTKRRDKNETMIHRHEENRRWMQDNRDQLIREGKEHSDVLRVGSKLGATVLHAEWSYPDLPSPSNSATYGNSSFTMRFLHRGLEIGSVGIQLTVYGWLMSEYPHYGPQKYHSGDELQLKVRFQGLAQPTRKVDPAYLGSRSIVLLHGLGKNLK
jgi:hypothetical protein